MKRFSRVFLWSLLVCSVPMLFVVRHFENTRVFDSIGNWYTVLVAISFSIPVAFVVSVGRSVVEQLGSKGKHD